MSPPYKLPAFRISDFVAAKNSFNRHASAAVAKKNDSRISMASQLNLDNELKPCGNHMEDTTSALADKHQNNLTTFLGQDSCPAIKNEMELDNMFFANSSPFPDPYNFQPLFTSPPHRQSSINAIHDQGTPSRASRIIKSNGVDLRPISARLYLSCEDGGLDRSKNLSSPPAFVSTSLNPNGDRPHQYKDPFASTLLEFAAAKAQSAEVQTTNHDGNHRKNDNQVEGITKVDDGCSAQSTSTSTSTLDCPTVSIPVSVSENQHLSAPYRLPVFTLADFVACCANSNATVESLATHAEDSKESEDIESVDSSAHEKVQHSPICASTSSEASPYTSSFLPNIRKSRFAKLPPSSPLPSGTSSSALALPHEFVSSDISDEANHESPLVDHCQKNRQLSSLFSHSPLTPLTSCSVASHHHSPSPSFDDYPMVIVPTAALIEPEDLCPVCDEKLPIQRSKKLQGLLKWVYTSKHFYNDEFTRIHPRPRASDNINVQFILCNLHMVEQSQSEIMDVVIPALDFEINTLIPRSIDLILDFLSKVMSNRPSDSLFFVEFMTVFSPESRLAIARGRMETFYEFYSAAYYGHQAMYVISRCICTMLGPHGGLPAQWYASVMKLPQRHALEVVLIPEVVIRLIAQDQRVSLVQAMLLMRRDDLQAYGNRRFRDDFDTSGIDNAIREITKKGEWLDDERYSSIDYLRSRETL